MRKYLAWFYDLNEFFLKIMILPILKIFFQTVTPVQNVVLKRNFWLRSPFWDFIWLHSGLWLWIIILAFSNQPELELFYIAGVFLFWISHRFSSFYIAWGTLSYRTLRASQPWRFKFIPAILVLSVFVILFIPEEILPVSVSVRILGLMLLDFFWGMHHFAAQHYGILRLFQNMENHSSSNSSKLHDRLFCWGMGFILVLIAELLHGVSFLQEKEILPSTLQYWENDVIQIIVRSFTLLVLVVTAILIRNAFVKNSGLPRILYILGLGIMVTCAFQLQPVEFLMLWTLQHWITALGLTAQMGGNDIKNIMSLKARLYKKFTFSGYQNQFIVLLPLCIISVILTPFFEIESVSSGVRYSELIFPTLLYWLENSSSLTFILGVGLASGFVHYFMDRAVYRFSDSETRKCAKDLLLSR
tara:strand:+ start:310 stop:1554 length:1245 start_codon:yes stop_codon:yes gene_type:complete